MSDLISREALLEEINKNFSFKSVGEILYIINTAPVINSLQNCDAQGEPVAYVSKETAYYFGISQKCESGVFRYGKFDDATIPLYTAPPQPQEQDKLVRKAVKDALEMAASICKDKAKDYREFAEPFAANICEEIEAEIRALIEE